jgi:hypothetical protein
METERLGIPWNRGSGNPSVVPRNLCQVGVFELMDIPPLENIGRHSRFRGGQVMLQLKLLWLLVTSVACASPGSRLHGILRPKDQKIFRIGNFELFHPRPVGTRTRH